MQMGFRPRSDTFLSLSPLVLRYLTLAFAGRTLSTLLHLQQKAHDGAAHRRGHPARGDTYSREGRRRGAESENGESGRGGEDKEGVLSFRREIFQSSGIQFCFLGKGGVPG